MTEAFAHPVTRLIVASVAAVLLVSLVAIGAITLLGRGTPALRKELWLRFGTWCVLLPLMLGPVLWGRVPTIAAVTLLSLLCYREFARATGLFREHVVSATVVAAILLVNFAALDHWYGFFVALGPLCACLIAVCSIPLDRPSGYVQRTGLALLGFMLFGMGLSHLGYMANDSDYRPIVLLLLTAVALNDVAAFTCGKLFGRRKLVPATSPGKTIAGSLGAVLVVAPIVGFLTGLIYLGTPMDRFWLLLGFGVLVSVAGQAGDLMLSSIKRDIGIKDMGATLPGHGGVLDRYNSLLLVSPAAFHTIGYFVGFGLDAVPRVITGG
jgi:phosphatidate cytidylyltransferase